MLGKDFSNSDLFRNLASAKVGWFYTNSNLSDNVQRLIAYRAVNNYPLVITVGLAGHEIFGRLEAQRKSGYLIATVLTLLILLVTGLSVGDNYRVRARKSVWNMRTCF